MNTESIILIRPGVSVALSELEFSAVRSSGPGGQNVNKVNSKVVLRWTLADSQSLSADTMRILGVRLEPQLTRTGDLVIASDRYRSQERNKADCIEKFQELLAAVLTPRKRRRKSKPSKGQRQARLSAKKQRSTTKQFRKKFSGDQ